MAKKRKGRKKPGRPSKLTPQLREEIVDHIKSGCFIETACGVASINKSTYYE